MKFTEEQYQKIVDIWNNEYAFVEGIKEVLNYIEKERLANTVYESAALANPVTREWAHEQFVEKEKKYVWSSKKADRDSNVLTLYIDEYGMVSTSYRKVYENNLRNENMLITESEIRAWGYNPEMFDKEEVE